MVQQQGIVKGDVLQKIASIGFIVGAILLVIFSVLEPRVSDPSDTSAVLQKFGENETLTEACLLLIAVGLWAVMAGVMGVYRAISARGAAWARLGFYGILIGTAILTISSALGMAEAGAAANWLAAPAPGQTIAYSIAASLHAGCLSVQTMGYIGYWLALAILGIGMVLSAVYPKWLGWVGIILGIGTMAAVGIVMAFAGPGSTTQVVSTVLSLLSCLYALAVGIWVARKAW
jgi:hypothetical protein